jgi:hypothetical protein
MNTETMKPTVNLNGTSPEKMIQDRLHARRMVLAAMEALGELAPNGRDYIGKPEDMKRDQVIHRDRVRFLDALYDALEDEAYEISLATA